MGSLNCEVENGADIYIYNLAPEGPGIVELDQLNKGQIVIFIFACLAGSSISGRSGHSLGYGS